MLSAVITSRPEMLKELYTKIASHLIGRFKVNQRVHMLTSWQWLSSQLKLNLACTLLAAGQEREENVRLDVVSCFTCLLKVRRRLLIPR